MRPRPGAADDAARMQDVGEEATRAAERARQGVGDGAEDEAPRRQLRQIGDHRRDHVAEVELAGLDEVAHGVLGRGEGPDQRLADVAADVARLRGMVRQRGGDRTPARGGLLCALGCGCPGIARGSSCATGCGGRVVEFEPERIRRCSGIGQCGFGLRPGARHSVAQRLPAGKRAAGGVGEHVPPLRDSRRPGRGRPRPSRRARGRAARGRCATAPPRRHRPQRRPQPRPSPRTGCRSGRASAGRACRSAPRLRPPPSRAAGRARRSAR